MLHDTCLQASEYAWNELGYSFRFSLFANINILLLSGLDEGTAGIVSLTSKMQRGLLAILGIAVLGLLTFASVGLHAASISPRISSASRFSDSTCSASGSEASRSYTAIGADPHGVSDSTGAIQRAIDAASSAGGGNVRLPRGTFLIDGHLILKNNVRVTGVGQATVLKAGPGFLSSIGPQGGYPLLTTSGASNITIAHLTANQNGNILNGNSRPGRLSAYLIDVRNSHNVVVNGVYTRNPFTYSIAVVGSSDFCVIYCNTRVTSSGRYNGLDGIHILDSNTGQVIKNYVDQRVGTDGDDGLAAHTINASVYDVLYARNIVRGGNGGDGMQLAVGNHPVYNIVIRDNDFWGSPFGIRTGYWNTGSHGTVHNVTITGNYIHDLVPGKAFPKGGNAIDIGGFGAVAPVTYITVTHNRTCHAGVTIVVSGIGNVVAHNTNCS
jgi:polygalacturonase